MRPIPVASLAANKQIGQFFVGYAAHDYHMLIFAALYAGAYTRARDTAIAMVAEVSPLLSSLLSPLSALLSPLSSPLISLRLFPRAARLAGAAQDPAPSGAQRSGGLRPDLASRLHPLRQVVRHPHLILTQSSESSPNPHLILIILAHSSPRPQHPLILTSSSSSSPHLATGRRSRPTRCPRTRSCTR